MEKSKSNPYRGISVAARCAFYGLVLSVLMVSAGCVTTDDGDGPPAVEYGGVPIVAVDDPEDAATFYKLESVNLFTDLGPKGEFIEGTFDGFCPKCKESGLTSTVWGGGGFKNALIYMSDTPYWDEDGRRHAHDSNTWTGSFTCSRLHAWSMKNKDRCWCGV